MTGERINFLIRACSGILAAVVWKPRLYRVFAVFAIEGIAVFSAFLATQDFSSGLLTNFFSNCRPTAKACIFVPWHRDGWLSRSR